MVVFVQPSQVTQPSDVQSVVAMCTLLYVVTK